MLTVLLVLVLVLEGVLPFYSRREHRVRHGLRNGTLAATSGAIRAALALRAIFAIVTGLIEHGADAGYLDSVRGVHCISDPDVRRPERRQALAALARFSEQFMQR